MIEARTNKFDWDQALTKIENYDCHHTYEYHELSSKEDETSLLLVFEKGSKIIALPLIKRKIQNSDYFDFTSAYGYVGPIYSNNITQNDIFNFKKSLQDYFIEEKIVSVFSRLNPFIKNQKNLLSNLGNVVNLSKVITIDLNKNLETQRSEYSKITRRYIGKADKLCTLKRSNSKEDILIFRDLYLENMNRVKANPFYFFSEEYFLKIINTQDFETEVIYAVLNETDEIISGAIMMKKNNIVHYHLSGTLTRYMKINPLRLILNEARIQATKEKYDYLNLGGGLGSKEDSLFQYKLTFSKEVKDFSVWKYIVNQDIYNSLSKKNIEDHKSEYFPLYRQAT